MKIALVSYEYPPDTAFGGIATYVAQAASLLAQRGHCVEVFAASAVRRGTFEEGGIRVNLVGQPDRTRFAADVQPIFAARHAKVQFDVVESPEYTADGREIRRSYPHVAHVVKLHTPRELLRQTNACDPQFTGWVRHHYVYLRRAVSHVRTHKPLPVYERFRPHRAPPSPLEQLERDYTGSADLVMSPSTALREWAIEHWSLDPERVLVVANPYTPSDRVLTVPVSAGGHTVGYFGRLEHRKGIADLVEAIPLILAAEPATRFRFVGGSLRHPGTGEPYETYVLRKLRRYTHSLDLVGHWPLSEMPTQYAAVDACVFPSIWENFPNVCLEAMAAGRAIVASHSGGMADMIEDGKHGILVAPRAPRMLAEAVIRLLQSPQLMRSLGNAARERVVAHYGADSVGPAIESAYQAAIARCRARASRTATSSIPGNIQVPLRDDRLPLFGGTQ